ncbi:2-aminoethylphosphonate--pyruvate transaminase-like isoform X1 [Ostrea edulis]|uniref:2-aminoethylphosphonate--pyruvate transaminase-like isoform X1 n=1 Tax=Ostrea edulis TaxID=37623 RepID=UPI0024AEA519|nr:2-aminoethylphosphonate--pyruvate transaminase-like isoform X1 [Ostrea edulis]
MTGVHSWCRRIPSIAYRNASILNQFSLSSRLLSGTALKYSSSGKEKKLFTPGPLSVSLTVRQAALRDLGSRDIEFISTVKFLRSKLLEIAEVSKKYYTAVPVQGSGTFAVEAVFHTAVPKSYGKVLVLENGAYGKRMGKICEVLKIPYHMEGFAEDSKVTVERVEQILRNDPSFSMVAIVHCETSSGVINPVVEVGQSIKKIKPDCVYFVDAMSSFGAVPLDLESGNIDFLVSSVNKCLQGIPGFSYAIAKIEQLLQCKGNSRSLSLDLHDQYDGLEKTGQFRFTPPTHCMLAFCQAIKEFEEEGGVVGRSKRYRENRRILQEGMNKLGFEEFLSPDHDGYIITSYKFPKDPNFDFKTFYSKLNEKDLVIYPGKVLNADCFRIGTIGQLFPEDFHKLLACIEDVCKDMNIKLPVT